VHHTSTRNARLLIICNITLKHNGTQEFYQSLTGRILPVFNILPVFKHDF